ncbi:unnamed protein product [Boreogadus saida]
MQRIISYFISFVYCVVHGSLLLKENGTTLFPNPNPPHNINSESERDDTSVLFSISLFPFSRGGGVLRLPPQGTRNTRSPVLRHCWTENRMVRHISRMGFTGRDNHRLEWSWVCLCECVSDVLLCFLYTSSYCSKIADAGLRFLMQ